MALNLTDSWSHVLLTHRVPALSALPLEVRSLGRPDQDFWDDHAFALARLLGTRRVVIFCVEEERALYDKLRAQGLFVEVYTRLSRDLPATEAQINTFFLNEAGFERLILQANDDVLGFVDASNRRLGPEAARTQVQELLPMMVWNHSFLGGYCPTRACQQKSSTFVHGNAFVPEHFCARVASNRFQLSDNWSKIDLERSVCCFILMGDNIRREDFIVQADRSKALIKTGCGPMTSRPEEAHARQLCALYPDYVKHPRPLKSGQWTLEFVQLARRTKLQVGEPDTELRKNSASMRQQRKRSISSLEDSELCELLQDADAKSASTWLALLKTRLSQMGQVLDEDATAVSLARRLAKTSQFKKEHNISGNKWRRCSLA